MNCTRCHKPAGRGTGFFSWLVPGGILVLMPKCPMCLAAYIALATGLGISLPAAANLRITMLVLCVSWLCFLVIRLIVLKTRRSSG